MFKLINTLKPDYKQKNKHSIGTKICSKIYLSNGDILDLSLGGFFQTMLNGEIMKDNLSLNFLFKKHIGYYNYVFYEDLHFFKELKKTSRLKKVQNSMANKKTRMNPTEQEDDRDIIEVDSIPKPW